MRQWFSSSPSPVSATPHIATTSAASWPARSRPPRAPSKHLASVARPTARRDGRTTRCNRLPPASNHARRCSTLPPLSCSKSAVSTSAIHPPDQTATPAPSHNFATWSRGPSIRTFDFGGKSELLDDGQFRFHRREPRPADESHSLGQAGVAGGHLGVTIQWRCDPGEQPRIYVHTPKHGSWLVETLFGKMARTFLRHIRVLGIPLTPTLLDSCAPHCPPPGTWRVARTLRAGGSFGWTRRYSVSSRAASVGRAARA